MQKFLPLVVTVVGTLSAAFAFPAYVTAHPYVFGALTAAAQLLHAALPSVFKEE